MPKVAVKEHNRISLRIRPDDKALIMRASTYEQTSLTDFIVRNVIKVAQSVIAQAEHISLSERDTQRVLDMLENPPAPNAKLLAAAKRLPSLP